MPRKTRPQRPHASLNEFLARHNATNWDVVLVGDGSGTDWEHPTAYAVVIIDRLTRRRELLMGGLSQGSVQLAELLPTLHALSWHDAIIAPAQRGAGFRGWNVHIFTDNSSVHTWITSGSGPPWVLILEGFRRRGYVLHSHLIPREEVELHVLVDHASRQYRRGLPVLDLGVLVPMAPGLQLTDLNPWEIQP